MKFRKLMCFVCAFIFFVTGCGTTDSTKNNANTGGADGSVNKPDNEVVSLRIWGAEADLDLLTKIVESFKQKYSSQATFNITIEAHDESDCKDSMLADVLNAPDVFTFIDDQVVALAAAGVLKPITYNADDVANRNVAASVSAASVNGKLYAYPLTADNGYFLYYNKAYLSEADVLTMDSLLKAAAAKGKKFVMDWNSGWYIYSFFGNTGLMVGLDSDGINNVCTWDSIDNAIKGVDVAEAMMKISSSKGFVSGNDDVLKKGAADGTVVAGVSGVWCSTELKKAWGDNLGATKLPTYTVAGKQVQMASYAGYKLVGVNSYSENVYWAEALADWISNEENQTLRFTMRGQGPSNTVAAASEAVAASPAIQAVIMQSEFASLQRIGGAYWVPSAEFGMKMANRDIGENTLQEIMDKLVVAITVKN